MHAQGEGEPGDEANNFSLVSRLSPRMITTFVSLKIAHKNAICNESKVELALKGRAWDEAIYSISDVIIIFALTFFSCMSIHM